MTPNRLHINLHEFESTSSYLSRVAALYGASDAPTFASWFGASFRDMCDGSRRDLEKVAAVVQQEPDVLVDRVLTGSSNLGRFWNMEIPQSYVRHYVDRICPGCVCDDIEHGTGEPELRAYGRMTWMMNHYLVCARHRRPLVTLPTTAWEVSADFRLRVAGARENTPAIFEPVAPVEPSPIDKYLIGRLEGFDPEPSWLDDLPLPIALRLCYALGEDDLQKYSHIGWGDRGYARINDGFVRIGQSEDGFRQRLVELIAAKNPRRRFTMSNVFREIGQEFARELQGPHLTRVTDIVREVAIQTLPLGPDDDIVGPLQNRVLHTVDTAAREFRLPASLMRIALKTDWKRDPSRKEIPVTFEKFAVEQAYRTFSETNPVDVAEGNARFTLMLDNERRGIAATRHDSSASLTLVEAAKRLATQTRVLWALADDGHLAIFPWWNSQPCWRISNSDIDEFLRRYMPGVELRKLLRSRRLNCSAKPEQDFVPAIFPQDVGADFYDRSRILNSF